MKFLAALGIPRIDGILFRNQSVVDLLHLGLEAEDARQQSTIAGRMDRPLEDGDIAIQRDLDPPTHEHAFVARDLRHPVGEFHRSRGRGYVCRYGR